MIIEAPLADGCDRPHERLCALTREIHSLIGELELNCCNRFCKPRVRVSHQAVILVTCSGFPDEHTYDSFVEKLKHFQREFPWQKVAFPLWLSTASLAASA